jgi:WD40 repeat protein
METGEPIQVLEGHRGRVHAVAWSPDGQWVITGSDDSTARIWLVNTRLIIAELTRRVCRLFTDEEMQRQIVGWRGGQAELEAVAKDLKAYDALQSRS